MNQIVKMDSADEYTVILTKGGQLFAWGKNDQGQMGTGAGIGMELVESENVPTEVILENDNNEI